MTSPTETQDTATESLAGSQETPPQEVPQEVAALIAALRPPKPPALFGATFQ